MTNTVSKEPVTMQPISIVPSSFTAKSSSTRPQFPMSSSAIPTALNHDQVSFSGGNKRTYRTNALGAAFWQGDQPQTLPFAENLRLAARLNISAEDYRELFPNGLSSPILQQIGDCYLMAGLRGLLDHPKNAALIQRIPIQIHRNASGQAEHYTVTLPNQKAKTYTHKEVTQGDCLGHREFKPARGPLWVKLIERAVADTLKDQRQGHPYFAQFGDCTLPYAIEGISDEVLAIVTGGEPVWFDSLGQNLDPAWGRWVDPTPEKSRMHLSAQNKKSFAQGSHSAALKAFLDTIGHAPQDWLMCANTPISESNVAFSSKIQVNNQTFQHNHAYCILNVNPDKQEVTLTDPQWDNKLIHVSYDDFCQIFQSISGVRLPSA